MTKTDGCLINLCLIYALLACLIVLKLVLHHFSYQSYNICYVTLSFLLRLVSKSPKKSDPPHAARRTEHHIFHVKYNIINELKLIYIYILLYQKRQQPEFCPAHCRDMLQVLVMGYILERLPIEPHYVKLKISFSQNVDMIGHNLFMNKEKNPT